MFTDRHMFFEDVEIGQEWFSHGRTITETDIVNFAGLSGDFNPIHTDHEFAKTTPFRRPIAHGLMVFSVASGLSVNYPPMRTLAFVMVKDWFFREPIFIGDTIRLLTRCDDKTVRGRGRRGEVTWYRGIYNQEDKIVQEGHVVTLVQGRGAVRDRREAGAAIEESEPAV